jgi:hypothetical protein
MAAVAASGACVAAGVGYCCCVVRPAEYAAATAAAAQQHTREQLLLVATLAEPLDPERLASLAGSAAFLARLTESRATAVDLSATDLCCLDGGDHGFAQMRTILLALPPVISMLSMPRSLGSCGYVGWDDGLGAVFARMSSITELHIESAITASSDATPGFVEALTSWLRKLPRLRRLALPDCCLHSAETLYSCSVGGSMLGTKDRCQFAALAAAVPNLEHLDLRGNILTRHDDRSNFGPPLPGNPFGQLIKLTAAGDECMTALTGCLRALPRLRSLRLGVADHETSGQSAWSAEQIAAVRACLSPGCTLDEGESTRYTLVLDENGCAGAGAWQSVPLD